MSVSSLEQFAYDHQSSAKYAYVLSDGRYGLFDKDIYTGNVFGDQRPFALYDFINNSAPQVGLDLTDHDILRLLFRNEPFLQFLRMGPNMALQAAYEMGFAEMEDRFQTFESLYQNSLVPEYYQEIMKGIDEDWETFRASVDARKYTEAYVETLERVETTQFREEKYVKTYRVHLWQFQSIFHLFDSINVTEEYPVVLLSDYYKVFKGYNATLDQIPESPNQLYIVHTANVDEPVQVSLDHDEKNSTIIDVTISVETTKDVQQVLQSVLRLLNIGGVEATLVANRFTGSFIVSQIVEPTIWQDVLMNNSIASELFVVDEHTTATRKRDAMFMYFLHEGKRVGMTFKATPVHTLVRLYNVDNLELVGRIMNAIVTCFGIYLQTGRKVMNEYNVLLKDRQVEFLVLKDTGVVFYNRPLKDVVPHMYKPNATRQCAHLPKLITNADADEVERKDPERLVKFPKKEEGQPVYNFYCDHDVFKYPGLRVNTLSNRDEYPVLPCCYKTSHRSQPQSNLNRYYSSDVLLDAFKATGEKVLTRHLITQKALGGGQKGDPPAIVSEMFHAVLNTDVTRVGMTSRAKSCLECILYVLNIDGYRESSTAQQQTALDTAHRVLENQPQEVFNLCAQECWDKGPDLRAAFQASAYIDPRYWIRLLEHVYNCRLVLFSRKDFIHPVYPMGCSRWEQRADNWVVYIYEHYGGEFERLDVPQYEALLLNTPLTIQDENRIVDLYRSSLVTYDARNRLQTFPRLSLDHPQYVLREQWIDAYGKVYGFSATHRTTRRRVTLYCVSGVLPPLELPRATKQYPSNKEERIVLGKHEFTTRLPESTTSLYQQFNQMQEQVDLMVENAKYKSRKLGSFEAFSRHIRIGEPRQYPADTFVDDDVINVPTQQVKNSLEYLVQLFMLRNKKQWEQMENRLFPEVYNSINKFRKSDAFILASTDTPIDWTSTQLVLEPLTKPYFRPFYCSFENQVFYATPVVSLPSANFILVIPQRKNSVRVGSTTADGMYLLFTQKKKHFYYRIQPVAGGKEMRSTPVQ